jgi:LysR family transcriptional regulator, transcriptional activator of the cysJI operon
MLKNINIDKLKIISSIYETGTLSATAKLNFVTASAVSQNLSSLENQLNKQLFMKVGKKLVPTDYCESLIQVYRPFAENLTSFLKNEATTSKEIKGNLKVFIPGAAGSKILADPISNFVKLHPKIKLSLESGSASRALKELHQNNFDFAICGLKKLIQQHRWCSSEFLFNLNLNLYCSKVYYQKNKMAIQSKKFENLSYVSSYQGQYLLNWYFEEILNKKFISETRVSVYDMNFMRKCVSNDLGVGLLASELIEDDIKSGKLIQISQKSLLHPMFLITQKSKELTHSETVFKEFLLNYFLK